jgi:hypothetical protein
MSKTERPFGCKSSSTHYRNMETIEVAHVPFAQLPIEARALFYIQSMAAWEYHCNLPHSAAEIRSDLERIWNAERLTPEDLRDWGRMSGLLKIELARCVQEQRRSKLTKEKTRCSAGRVNSNGE